MMEGEKEMNGRKWINPVTIENAELIFKNFAGRPDTYHPNGGDRSFGIVLSKELADELTEEGWTGIKVLEANDEYSYPKIFIKAKVNYGIDKNTGLKKGPKIYMICNNKKTLLDEITVGELDRAEIEYVDVTFGPSFYMDYVTAYVTEMYVTIKNIGLSQKYSYLDDPMNVQYE